MTHIEDRIQRIPDKPPLVVPADKVISIEPYLPEPDLAEIIPFPLQGQLSAEVTEDDGTNETDNETVRREKQLFAPIKAAQVAFQHIQTQEDPLEAEEVAKWQKTALISKGKAFGEVPEGLTREELWDLVRSGHESVLRIAQQSEPLVKYVIGKLKIPSENLEDIFNTGYLGLLDAAASFNPDRGARFSTWAVLKIRGAILDEFRRNSPIPRSVTETSKRISLIENKLAQRLGRMPTESEVAQAGEIKVQKLRQVKQLGSTTVVSSDNEDEEGFNLWTRLADEVDITQDLIRDETVERIARLIEDIPDARLRRVYELYYKEDRSMAFIASDLGVSESRISQLHARLLGVARARFTDYEISDGSEFRPIRKRMVQNESGNIGVVQGAQNTFEQTSESPQKDRYIQDTENCKSARKTEAIWSQLTPREQSFIAPLSYGFSRVDTIRRLSLIYKRTRADIGREMHKTLKRLQSLTP